MARDEEQLDNMFSGEETYGKYLDLHELYDVYVNLPQFRRVEYAVFLDEFDRFVDVPLERKNGPYRKYLLQLVGYLSGFILRAKPLVDLHAIEQQIEKQFRARWESGQVLREKSHTGRPLFCAACDKLFAKDTVFDAHLKGKKHVKAVEDKSKRQNGEHKETDGLSSGIGSEVYEIHLLEERVGRLAQLVAKEREDTKANIERKQALTSAEREEDLLEEEQEIQLEESESDDDEEKPIYNPLKLPLGWDGKPIPYWLYKLHGLGVEYPCEICGGYVYMGRKAFERHFQEWRHSHGMRCLGIPNSKHYQEITSIEDALARSYF